MVINRGYLALRNFELSHHFLDKFNSVLKRSVRSYLNEHRNLIELGLAGYVGEVILAIRVFLRIKRKIKCKCSTLDINLSALDSSLVEGLAAPACSSLNALIGEKNVLDHCVVILNVALRLNQT